MKRAWLLVLVAGCGHEPPVTAVKPPPAAAQPAPRAPESLRDLHARLSRQADDPEIRALLDDIESRANLAFRKLYRPVQAEIRAARPRDAHRLLMDFKVPADIDIAGRFSADRARDLAMLAELAELEELPVDADLSRFLASRHVAVRAEAELVALRQKRRRHLESTRRQWAARLDAPSKGFVFGAKPGRPVPTESRIGEPVPDEIAAARSSLAEAAKAPTLDAFVAGIEAGRDHLDAAVRTSAFHPAVWFHRAEWRYAVQGDVLGAVEDLDEAVERQPDFLEARLARAKLKFELGLTREAVEELTRLRGALIRPMAELLAPAIEQRSAAAVEKAMEALPPVLEFLFLPAKPRREGPPWKEPVVVESRHYRLMSTMKRERLEEYAKELEAARGTFESMVALPASSGRVTAYLFENEQEYREYCGEDGSDHLGATAGQFLPGRNVMVMHLDPDEAEFRDTLRHEALHAYVDALDTMPAWIEEGLAMDAGAKGGDRPDTRRRLATAAEEGWKGASARDLLRGTLPEVHGILESLRDAQAWSLVRHLRAKYAKEFGDYLARLAKGASAAEAESAAFARVDGEMLEQEWRKMVRGD